MPIKRIAARLAVSPGTVHAWTRDIELTPQQRARNLYGPRGPQNKEDVARRAAAWAERNREIRRGHQLEGRIRARQREPLHLAGCMLYWAEGSKCRNSVRLANSDVHMGRFFRMFVADCFNVSAEDFRVRLNVYLGNGLTLNQIEQHWLRALDLPQSCTRKHTTDHLPTSSSGQRRNKLPYGVCELRVDSTRIVQHIYGAIQEYAHFEEPNWMDGPRRKARSRGAPRAADSGA